MIGAMRHGGLFATLLLMLAPPAAAAPLCLGDCDGDGVITRTEFECARPCAITIVPCPSDECLECIDADGDGRFAIGELVQITNNAVRGCPGSPRCDGDCDGDRRVHVSEILYGVGAALNGVPTDDSCPDFTFCPIGQACIDIASLQRAVAHALRGCPSQ